MPPHSTVGLAVATDSGRSVPVRWLAVLLWLVAVAGPVSASDDPQALLRQIRSPELNTSRTVPIRNVEIDVGPASLTVEEGILIPSRPIEGRIVELLFIGTARLRLEPPDEIEASQLELFSGERAIDAPVESAVLVMVDQEVVERLIDRPGARAATADERFIADRLYQEWLTRAERRTTILEAALFKALIDDRAFAKFFSLWCRSRELGDLVFQLDPEDVEQVTLASFTPIDIQGWDRQRLERHIRVHQRKGRWLGVRVEDLGAWDVWLSTPWTPDSGDPLPGDLGFESDHYTIDLELDRRGLKAEGTARIELTAQQSGRRVVNLSLFRDLEIVDVRDGQGDQLFHFRSGAERLVVLPEPSEAGQSLVLEVSYRGRVLQWVGRGRYDLEHTSEWYPHVGTIDRATYDVTLRWPRKYELLASGKKVEEGTVGRYRWERRVLQARAIAFSFTLGKFQIEKRQVGHVELTLAFNRGSKARNTPELREDIATVVEDSLRFFEQNFGPYPLDELTVVTVPRPYSQAYLGFITLSESILYTDSELISSGVRWVRDTTIAHEVAHQWWGNLLGWWSYRDQWLSEAMANYSGLLFYSRERDGGRTFLADMSAGWRNFLSQPTRTGRTVEALGPIVLGGRLNSSLASNGYRAIVYRKGAAVLAMLSRAVGEEAFLKMLRSLVEAASNRVMTTELFVEAMERMSGLDLEGFARQYIYGTGIPEIYYEYEFEREKAGWVVAGRATQLTEPQTVHRVTRDGGSWDVQRELIDRGQDVATALMVPYRIDFKEPSREEELLRMESSEVPARPRQLFLEGPSSEFRIDAEQRPLALTLDPGEEILARFYSAVDHPKRVKRYRADDLWREGKWAEAEEAFRAALGEQLGAPLQDPPLPWMSETLDSERKENASIRLSLARLLIDRGRDSEAGRQIELADALLDPDRGTFRIQRDVLKSRLDLRCGEYESAFRRLRKTLKLAGTPGNPSNMRQLVWSLRLNSDRDALTEAYAILAISAFETGDRDVLDWALTGARQRGVDIDPLETQLASEAGKLLGRAPARL